MQGVMEFIRAQIVLALVLVLCIGLVVGFGMGASTREPASAPVSDASSAVTDSTGQPETLPEVDQPGGEIAVGEEQPAVPEEDVPASASAVHPAGSQGVEVLRWSGSENTHTDTFTVQGTWQLHWDIRGGGAGVIVRAKDVSSGRTIADVSPDDGRDSSMFRVGCTCYLEIRAYGSSYTVWVVDLPG